MMLCYNIDIYFKMFSIFLRENNFFHRHNLMAVSMATPAIAAALHGLTCFDIPVQASDCQPYYYNNNSSNNYRSHYLFLPEREPLSLYGLKSM
jgi:hypothetical protein